MNLSAVLLLWTVGACASERISVDWVKARVDRGEVSSIEQLLHALPVEYRSEFTLLEESLSRQAASLQDPRVVFYGKDATFILAVNGGQPGVPGADVAEMIQFNSVERKFEFFELEEHAGREGQGGSVTLKRGVGCTDCHRSDPRPNWQPYSQWPGGIGGNDDRLSHRELVGIDSLKERAAGHPRYSALAGLDSRYQHHGLRQDSEPNISFTQRVAQLNFLRVTRLIQQTPDYDRFKYSILGSIVCNPDSRDIFFPRRLLPPNLDDISGDYGERGRSAFLRLFEARGIDTRDWSMVFLPESDPSSRFEFTTPGRSPIEMAGNLVQADPELAKYANLVIGEYQGVPRFLAEEIKCRELAEASKGSVPF